jgi:hypothetical protein
VSDVTITPTDNGPYLIEGPVEFIGTSFAAANRAAHREGARL